MSLFHPRRPPASFSPFRKANPLLRGEEPFTLWDNLRNRPLAFIVAGLGLFGVLAVKTLIVRNEPVAPKPDRRRKVSGQTIARLH